MFSSKVRSWLFFLAIILISINIWIWLAIRVQSQYQAPLPVPGSPPSSIHSQNSYQEAWIQYVDKGLVQVQVIDTKVIFIFRPTPKDIVRFVEGNIAAITFLCDQADTKCDPTKPDKMYANSVPVELLLARL